MQSDGKLGTEHVLAAVELMGRVGREGTMRVQGESMRPTLRPDQMLAVDFAPEGLARGDMLVFRQGETLLVHRLVGPARPLEGRRRLKTRGDGVGDPDPPVELDRVVGRVVAFEDDGRLMTTRRRPARAYAWCLAQHDLFWSRVAWVSRGVDRRMGRWRIPLRIQPWVLAIDRRLLRLVHHALFERVHPEVPKPAAAGDPTRV
jgi:signal peptidase I